MSAAFVFMAAFVVTAAVIMLRYGHPTDLGDYIALALVVWGAVLYVISLTLLAGADYELETGEYLRCTPEGGNTLTCEVHHREDK